MLKKHIILLLCLFITLPSFATNNDDPLSNALKELRRELKQDYQQMSITKQRLSDNYDSQHQKMVGIMKECNELSLKLYSQKQEFTFDLSFTLEKVKREFKEFEKDKMPYNRIVNNLDLEVDRYARLIETLRRLPPELDTVYGLHDSLIYRNDSLDLQHLVSATQLEQTIEAATLNDSVSMPYILDKAGQQNRDSCIFYAKELMKMYFESKSIIVADSIHYNETYMRLKESYDYASDYYKLLQHRIFIEGQTPWTTIIFHFNQYWKLAKFDTKDKYSLETTLASTNNINNNLPSTENNEYSYQIVLVFLLIVIFLLVWLIARILLIPVFNIKPIKSKVAKQQKPYFALLLGAIIFAVLVTGASIGDTIIAKAISLSNTFIWLLAAIITALLIRLKPEQLKKGIRIYRPTIFTALIVIGCRVLFIPNSMMNIFFPPCLIILFLWQLFTCLRRTKEVDSSDRVFSWVSLAVTGAAMIIALFGYIFASLMILVWWYFQMAAILTMITIWHLMVKYKEKRMNPRISQYLEHITMVSGQDKKTYLYRVTWFYDLVKEVVLPTMVLTSLVLCLNLAMNVFDFDDLYENLFNNPFIQFTDNDGESVFRISLYSIILLSSLFFVFRYLNHAIHSIWQQNRYAKYLKKTQRKTIHKDEVNLSLGNSIISFIIWVIYAVIVVLTLHIPTGSLSLVAGGFSAGVGLALKDIINNFIYGIQLMSGRLKIGDWIECDGIRGKVTNINYQTTQVETVNNTTVSFLNASLFAKNFTNLTKGNPYELLKLSVGVAYGTDVQHVREVIENAMQVMRTKDTLGRDIVEPNKGIYVRIAEFGDSAVEIMVKQYVLASEHIPYTDKAKEVIYNALNENGITIPFPQRDIHVIMNAKDLD